MAWYNPTTWFQPKKEVSKPTPSLTPAQQQAQTNLINQVNKTTPSNLTSSQQQAKTNLVTAVNKPISNTSSYSGGSSYSPSPSSPTGYVDTLNQPVSIKQDASYTSGGSTYNVATRVLENNKPINRGTISNMQLPTPSTNLLMSSTKPTLNDVAPKTFLGKIYEGAQTLYVASPFGASTKLPNEYNVRRTTGKSKYLNVLTLGEAQSGIREEKLKKLTGEYQIGEIDKFKAGTIDKSRLLTSGVEINEVKPNNLSATSFNTFGQPISKNESIQYFNSNNWKPSISTNEYQWKNENTNIGKVLLGTRIVSTKATETYAMFYGAELTRVPSAIGRAGKYLASGGLGTTGKVAGYGLNYGLPTAFAGGYGLSKVNQYTQSSSKPVFWLETGGEVAGFGTYLESKGYGAQYTKFETPNGNVRTVYFGSKPLIVSSPKGTTLGFPKENPFGNQLPTDIYGTKIGSSFANKYASQLKYENPSNLDVINKGYSATKVLRNVNYKGNINLDLSKSRMFNDFNPEAQKVTTDFLKTEGQGSTGWTGLKNAILNKNRLQSVYGSASSVSKGALNREFGDIDIQFTGEGQPKATDLFNRLNKAQPNTFRLQKGTSLIEMKSKKGDYVHAFDIHGSDTPLQGMASETPLGFKMRKGVISLIDNKKIPTSSVGQEATNKGASVLQFRYNEQTGLSSISPEEHRMKDVGDWYNIIESLNKQAGKKAVNLNPFKESLTKSFGDFETGTKTVIFNSPSTSSNSIPMIFNPSKSSSSYKSIKYSPSSISNSISNSLSKVSLSSYSSPSKSSSNSVSFSPSFSPSPSPSRSPSPSPSPSISLSPSFSPSFSPSPSPSRSPSPSPSPYEYIPPSIIPFSFPSGDFDFFKGSRSYKGKRRTKYTPSFEALVFNIRGKAPKGIETGARLRPIPKGFTFAFNKPKFKWR